MANLREVNDVEVGRDLGWDGGGYFEGDLGEDAVEAFVGAFAGVELEVNTRLDDDAVLDEGLGEVDCRRNGGADGLDGGVIYSNDLVMLVVNLNL